MTPQVVRYGRWPSPISADLVATASTTYDATIACNETVYWVESRPCEGGRSTLVRWTEDIGPTDLLPVAAAIGSMVYEYGGGAYAVTGDSVWFCAAQDQRIYRLDGNSPPVPLTDVPGSGSVRYGDLRITPDGNRLVCVREQHQHDRTSTDLVAIPARGGRPASLASGWDFYAAPEPSPNGRSLAWITWRDPLMPWDGSWLWVASLLDEGLGKPLLVAGGPAESVVQPKWSRDGILHFVSDRAGWWNLYRWHHGHVEPVASTEAEMGVAPWELGYSTYAFLDDGRVAVLLQEGGRTRLVILDPASGELVPAKLPYTSIKPYLSTDGQRVALIGSSPSQTPTVALVDVTTGEVQKLTRDDQRIDTRHISIPQPFTYATRDGDVAHGLFHPPTNPGVAPPPGEAPPLIVRPHPGPTSNAPHRLDPAVQFFTSRGFAVADIDYRGSTGYGRAYRTKLNGCWGVLDVTDCVDAAHHLVRTGRADPEQLVISGASAGGFTALRALATTTDFAAGTARSAIIDPAAWRQTAPPFQRHHTDTLIGPWPEDADTYRSRSVLDSANHIRAPVLLLHGDSDPIVPVREAQLLAGELKRRGGTGTMRVFPGEGHTFRMHEHIREALEVELELYVPCGGSRFNLLTRT